MSKMDEAEKWTGHPIFLDLSIFQNGQLSIFQIQCNFELSQFDFWGEKLSPAHFLGHLSILKNGPVQKKLDDLSIFRPRPFLT